MNNNIALLLKEYGLDHNEIKIYICLVGKKELTAYHIAKDVKIHRSTCYDILERLVAKGFIARSGDKNKLYSANEITKIIGRVKSKEAILLSLIPEIQRLESKNETYVKHFDSSGSYIEIDTKISELVKARKLSYVYMIGNGPNLSTPSSMIMIEKIIRELSKERNIKKVDCKGLWDKRFKRNEFMKQFNTLGENRFLEDLPTQVTTIIFDNHVAFLFFEDNENVIEIKNKKISNEMKIYFNYLWEKAKK